MQSVTQQAIAAVGHHVDGDWALRPSVHAEDLPAAAGALKRVLGSSDLEDLTARYAPADVAAVKAQKRYKRLARTAAYASFAAVVVGSLGVLPASGVLPGQILTTATILQALTLILSFGCSLVIVYFRPFETWMQRRATAETTRIGLFDRVLAAKEDSREGELPLLPLQLEYFRRYQLDVQRAYYRERGRQHGKAARRAWLLRLLALGLVILALFPIVWSLQGKDWLPSSIAELLSELPASTEAAQRLFLGFGLVAAGLQGLLAALALMSLDERNAARYLATSDNLETLADKPLDEARAAAATVGADREGARATVLSFVALVQEQISVEHREWVVLRKVAGDLSLDQLASLRRPPRG